MERIIKEIRWGKTSIFISLDAIEEYFRKNTKKIKTLLFFSKKNNNDFLFLTYL